MVAPMRADCLGTFGLTPAVRKAPYVNTLRATAYQQSCLCDKHADLLPIQKDSTRLLFQQMLPSLSS